MIVAMRQPSPTPLHQLIEARLGVPLADWVADRRNARPPASWRSLAADLRHRTGTPVTHEALRRWFSDSRWYDDDQPVAA